MLDPIGTINSFNSFILSLFGELVQVGQKAISTVEESKKAIESLVGSVVDSARKDVETLVEKAATDIWKAVNNSVIGTAIRIEQCAEKGIANVSGDAFKTGKYFFEHSVTRSNNLVILWILKFPCWVHQIPQLDTVLKHLNPTHNLTLQNPNIHFGNYILLLFKITSPT